MKKMKSGWVVALIIAAAIAGCGGGGDKGSNDSPSGNSPEAPAGVAILQTTTMHAIVKLPGGVSGGLTTDKLTVLTSLGSATPDASGAVTLPVYEGNDTQLAVVMSPAGTPMMLGWLDNDHSTLSALTTADVLAYFALSGGTPLTKADFHAFVTTIATAPGIATFETTLQSLLAANPEYLASPNMDVAHALSDFVQPLLAAARPAAVRKAMATQPVLIGADLGTQSGLTFNSILPSNGYLQNTYRRRAFAYVDRVSFTKDGVETAAAAAVTNFEVPPVSGVNGGVFGTVNDIVNAYYGLQQTAYGPVAVPDATTGFPLALVDGSDSTKFQITVVGAGAFDGVKANLTDVQSAQLTEVALRSFANDLLVPFMANAVLGSGAIDFTSGVGAEAAKKAFLVDMAGSIVTDLVAVAPTVPGLVDQIRKGEWQQAMQTLAASNALRTFLKNAFDSANKAVVAAYPDTTNKLLGDSSKAVDFFKGFDAVVNATGGVLQLIDAAAFSTNFAQSNQADQWTVTVKATDATLSPASSTINPGASATLTAGIRALALPDGYSYFYATSGKGGTLSQNGAGTQTGALSFCSSNKTVNYVANGTVTNGVTDTVTVEIYDAANCATGKGHLLGTASAAVKVQYQELGAALTPATYVFVSTDANHFAVNAQAFQVHINGVSDTSQFTYCWQTHESLYGEPLSTANGSVARLYIPSTSPQAYALPGATGTWLDISPTLFDTPENCSRNALVQAWLLMPLGAPTNHADAYDVIEVAVYTSGAGTRPSGVSPDAVLTAKVTYSGPYVIMLP